MFLYCVASDALIITASERNAVKISAAPIIPRRKPKIKTGSKIMLATAPARVESMANFGLPSARITVFIA